MKRVLLITLIALGAILFFAFDFDEWLTLDALRTQTASLIAWRDAAPWRAAALFAVAYVSVTALSLPGAALMTLAAGALFGLWWGTLLVSFASSLGALLAFLATRYLLRDLVHRRFEAQLRTVDSGIERDGAFYLFTLRLVPLMPFFLVNLLLGLTALPARTFYWVSQLGMLPGSLVYVNAGQQISTLSSVGDVFSPTLLGSFALLGALPWLGRAIARSVTRRRLYARWRKPARFDRNLVVIGAGAAGLVAAYIGAAVKARVTLVEAHKMGGDCLNYGCVPSKALIKSARVAHLLRHAERYGIAAGDSRVAFKRVLERVRAAIETIAPHDSVERYNALGVEVLAGHARIVDPWTVEVTLNTGGTQRLTTRGIVVAAGASPVVPPLPGLQEAGYLTSDTLWEGLSALEAPPARVVVLGGGPIGTELSQALARLGSIVSQVEMGSRLLSREDDEVSALARAALEADGVEVLTGHEAVRCECDAQGRHLVVRHAGDLRRLPFDLLICAVGRKARLGGYGLEELGIETERTIVTNEYLETLYPNIYAAGDVAGPYQFTHTAAHQAWYASVNALFGTVWRFKVDYRTIPWTTFIEPEVARVGVNEQEARERNIAHEVTRYELSELDRAIADGTTAGFVKVLTVPGKDRILGVTIVGEHAGELLAEFVLAMRWGLGLNKILSTIHTYPTLAEANKYVAGEWKRAHAPALALAWLERFHTWQRH
jgi:pyruvate/2-oxoglutarate dehydrogenase complex dihydrolipoamide dehydrogenase (E3) component/uncharacterized membrane protein YdjX (TVP38/TMEM64 family)